MCAEYQVYMRSEKERLETQMQRLQLAESSGQNIRKPDNQVQMRYEWDEELEEEADSVHSPEAKKTIIELASSGDPDWWVKHCFAEDGSLIQPLTPVSLPLLSSSERYKYQKMLSAAREMREEVRDKVAATGGHAGGKKVQAQGSGKEEPGAWDWGGTDSSVRSRLMAFANNYP
jgi:hypothetical protein